MMKLNRRNLMRTLAAASVTTLPLGRPFAQSASRPTGRLRIAFPGSINRLHPQQAFSMEDQQLALCVSEGLVGIGRDLLPTPVLAERWDNTGNGRVWTFQLRQNVRFHNNAPFTAADVVATVNRIRDQALSSPLRTLFQPVTAVDAVDPRTVRISLSAPNVDFPLLLAAPQAGITPAGLSDEELSRRPIGTGPFRFESLTTGERARLLANETYWQPDQPKVGELQLVLISEAATQLSAIASGAIDVIGNLAFPMAENLRSARGVRVLEVASGGFDCMMMKVDQAPFNDVRVRQALRLLCNRPDMLVAVQRGRGELAHDNPVAPISPFHRALPQRARNVAEARRLLAEAGHSGGLELTLLTGSFRPGWLEMAVAFQEMAREGGVRININNVPASNYLAVYRTSPFSMSNKRFRASIDEMLTLFYHSEGVFNDMNLKSPQVDQWLADARADNDMERRKRLYGEFQQFFQAEGGELISIYRPSLYAVRETVRDFEGTPMQLVDLRNVSVRA